MYFYEIVGSAAGALTGLQFVVIALIAQIRASGSMQEIRAFGTPTVIHFCSSLVLAALMAAPWGGLEPLSVCVGVVGGLGVAYSCMVFRHAQISTYNPDLEDWIWYAALPLVAHAALVGAAFLLRSNANWALGTIAADTILFLLIGIHNSWDTVTYIAIKHGAVVSDIIPT
jgi:hypothetical protein